MSDLGSSFSIFVLLLLHLRSLKIFLYKKNSAYLLSTNIYPKGGQLLLLASEWVSSRRMIWNLVIHGLFISDSLKLNLILFKGVTLSMHFLLRWSAANGDTRESIIYVIIWLLIKNNHVVIKLILWQADLKIYKRPHSLSILVIYNLQYHIFETILFYN